MGCPPPLLPLPPVHPQGAFAAGDEFDGIVWEIGAHDAIVGGAVLVAPADHDQGIGPGRIELQVEAAGAGDLVGKERGFFTGFRRTWGSAVLLARFTGNARRQAGQKMTYAGQW